MQISEIQDCMKWIDFRYFSIHEFGVGFNDKNEMEFHIDYQIGSACMNVSATSVSFDLKAITEYLR